MARVISICNQKGGVGKCLAPDTPVLLASGEAVSIEGVFRKYAGSNVLEGSGYRDEVFVKPRDEVRVFSLDDDLKIVESKVEALYRGKADKLFEVKNLIAKAIVYLILTLFISSSFAVLAIKFPRPFARSEL